MLGAPISDSIFKQRQPSFRGARSASPESITTTGSMDSGPAPSGASRNDDVSLQIRLRALAARCARAVDESSAFAGMTGERVARISIIQAVARMERSAIRGLLQICSRISLRSIYDVCDSRETKP